MPRKTLFVVAVAGILMGLAAAWFFSESHPPQPPAFKPASKPYPTGIYASGIIESAQGSGQNVPIYPEVAGSVTAVNVVEGQTVTQGSALLLIDSTVLQHTADQQKALAEAARAQLTQLKAQPRAEVLSVTRAQAIAAAASVRVLRDQFDKLQRAADIDARSVSREAIDTAANALRVGEANLAVTQRQLELVQAGAWSFDIKAQEQTVAALDQQVHATKALLDKYVLRAPIDGVVLAINVAQGGYVAPSGTYQTYTEASGPVVVMGRGGTLLQVRVYVDEILVHRLPAPDRIVAQMQVRGTERKVALKFLRIQPYVTPKIQLSNQREELVDVRVLPILFTVEAPKDLPLYAGQLVDVYIGSGEGG